MTVAQRASRYLWPALLGAAILAGCDETPTEVLPQPDPTQKIRVGETYRFVLGTHCGVKYIAVAGARWRAVKPLDGSPPPGWDSGQRGRLKIVDDDTAVFRDSLGHVVTFKRQPHQPQTFCM